MMEESKVDQVTAQNENLLRAYQLCFGSAAGQTVLVDLAAFCRAVETTVVTGSRQLSDVLAGRREAFLRIQQFARLTDDEILQLRLGRISPKPQAETEN